MKTLKINVIKKHINEGHHRSGSSCPIALAIASKTGRTPIVAYKEVYFIGGTSIALPKKAKTFIEDFDNDRPVKPFSFNLRYEI